MATKSKPAAPARIQLTELQELTLRVECVMSAKRLWQRLTPEDRRRLGGDLEAA